MYEVNRRRAILILVALAGLTASACAGTTELVDPQPIAAAATPAQTRSAILRALSLSHWAVDSEKPGEVIARLAQRDWTMVIAISYSTQVTIRYVSSTNLRYATEDGVPVIHKAYNKRVARLQRVIAREIPLAIAEPPPPR